MTIFDGTRLAVLDTETTGFDPAKGHRLIEVACVWVEDGEIGEAWSRLVDPGRAIPEEAIRVHGIKEEMVRGAPAPATLAAELESRCAGRVLVFHNAAFDLPFLRQAFKLPVFDEVMNADEGSLFHVEMIDTLGLARGLAEPGSNSLGDLAIRLGVNPGKRHRAEGDALTTAMVLLKLGERWEQRGVRTIPELARESRAALARSSRVSRGG